MLALNFKPFPKLETSRCILRRLRISDAPEIFVFRSDKRMLEFIDIPEANSLEDAEAFIEKINRGINANESIMWGIQRKDSAVLSGTICLWNVDREKDMAELGYMLHPDAQGKGLVSEAVHSVIDFGFKKMKLKQVTACVKPSNTRSVQVLLRAGFTFLKEDDKESTYILSPSHTIATGDLSV